jgi:predicted PhzF superfamily epimerase YddE/YHI9
MPMGQSIVQVDAFTSRPFLGNPAAVCVMSAPADERWMQALALEMNLSETAFLHPDQDGYRLRWFTPAVEVDLCGHATVASAHVLWTEGHLPHGSQARFYTRSGLLTADRTGDWIELDFPSTCPVAADPPEGLDVALGSSFGFVGRSRFDLFVVLPSESRVRELRPDLTRLAAILARGVIVTAAAQLGPFDFVSRFFAPAAGIAEDPVTGSAHCTLAPYWAERLGKNEMIGYQASARGGVVRVRVDGPRVRLGGQAVTVMRGELTFAADRP